MLELLGVPQDAIEVVANLYSGASTRLRVPAGLSDPVAILRGTIQGDSLSPLLFLLYLEPLLQWLSVDDDGYLPGCASDSAARSRPPSDRPEQACYGAYADDLVLLARSLPGLRRMVAKLDAYAAWTGMAINASKCAFSALVPQPPSLPPPVGGGRQRVMRDAYSTSHPPRGGCYFHHVPRRLCCLSTAYRTLSIPRYRHCSVPRQETQLRLSLSRGKSTS